MVVFENPKGRPVMFSSFQPDAAQMVRKLQSTYLVYFLTNGGCEIYIDIRRNSLDEAIKQHKNQIVNEEFWNEARTYGDIQLMPFVDYYSLITWKTLAICTYRVKQLLLGLDTQQWNYAQGH